MHLRETGIIPWHWIEDETRSVDEWIFAPTVHDYVTEAVDRARIDLWQGEEPPFVINESRAARGMLRNLARQD